MRRVERVLTIVWRVASGLEGPFAITREAVRAAAPVRRALVLLGTGRPSGLLEFYAELASTLSASGGEVLTREVGRSID